MSMDRELETWYSHSVKADCAEETATISAQRYGVVQDASSLACEPSHGDGRGQTARVLQLLWDTWECETSGVLLRPYHEYSVYMVESSKSKTKRYLGRIHTTPGTCPNASASDCATVTKPGRIVRCGEYADASHIEEPRAVVPHAGICEGNAILGLQSFSILGITKIFP